MNPDRGERNGRTNGPTDDELREAVPRPRGGNELRVGLFVLIGVLSVVVTLFVLTDPATLRGRYMVVTVMNDAGGIRVGDPVQMRGVNIGRINAFEMTRDGRVAITMEIEGKWGIPEDSRAALGAQGIFGGRTMQVEPGNATAMVEPRDTIDGAEQSADLLAGVEELERRATGVLGRMGDLLEEPTVSDLRSGASDLRALLAEVRGAAERQREQLDELTASLNRSARGLEEAADAGPEAARAVARADSAMAQLNRTTVTLESAVSSLDGILARVDRGEGTLGRFVTDDSLYTSLNQAADNLNRLLTDLRENPSRYIDISIF